VKDFASQIGGFIWIAIVLIGVVSSIAKSAKRQNAAKAPPGQAPEVRVAGVPQGIHAQFGASASEMPPVAAPSAPVVPPPVRRQARNLQPAQRPQPAPVTPPIYAAPPVYDTTPPPAAPHSPVIRARRARAAKLFGSPSQVLRSVIAAEVLGKPRALRDEY
jgi:hypothetical protein